MTSTETQTLQVPLEACAFLAAVGGFVVLLFIFFLYLNKALCFNKCSILPCDTNGPVKSQSKSKRLSSTVGYEDPNETSSDSDDEVLRRYQQSITVSRSQSHHAALGRTAAKLKCVTELVKRGGHSFISGKHPATSAGSNKEESRDRKQTQEPVVKESAKFTIGDPEQENDIDDSVVIRSPSGASLDRVPIIVPGERRASDLKHPAFQAPDEDSSSQSQCYQNKAFPEMEAAGLEPEMIPPQAGSEKDHQLSDQGAASVGFDDSNSNGDQDENLFDTGDLQDHEPIIISKCGNLSVSFHYQTATGRMSVTVHGARDIPSKDRGGAHHTQVRLLLLPTKKAKHKTKIKTGEAPSFEETFQFKVPIEELNNMGIRFRLYGCERMRRERMIGECVFAFVTVALDSPVDQWLTLEPRSNFSHGDSKTDITSLTRSDSGSSCQSMQHGGMPELLIGLSYNGMTGRLAVQVIKGSNFKNMAMTRAPDTYVKLTLMSPTGQEIARSKTSIRRGQPHPLFKETFMFQIPLFQLPDVTLMVSVFYNKSIKRKEMIGWFSLGFSNSSDEELSHWTDMRESKHEDEVCRWHVLLEP